MKESLKQPQIQDSPLLSHLSQNQQYLCLSTLGHKESWQYNCSGRMVHSFSYLFEISLYCVAPRQIFKLENCLL